MGRIPAWRTGCATRLLARLCRKRRGSRIQVAARHEGADHAPNVSRGSDSHAGVCTCGAPMILAGDIGATKALLLLAALRQGRIEPVLERRYAVASFPG